MVFMLNAFLRRKDYLGHKVQRMKRKSMTNKDRKQYSEFVPMYVPLANFPPKVSENAKQDTLLPLLPHCNLLMLGHLKRMMEFGVQGERGLARFQ